MEVSIIKPSHKPRRRKSGEKKVHTHIREKQFSRVIKYMTFGRNRITNEDNIKEGCKPYIPLTEVQASREVGIGPTTMKCYMRNHTDLREAHNSMKASRREYMKNIAEENILKAVNGEFSQISEDKRVDYSFRLLEKTDQNYNPKQVVEQTVESINPAQTEKMMLEELLSLISQ